MSGMNVKLSTKEAAKEAAKAALRAAATAAAPAAGAGGAAAEPAGGAASPAAARPARFLTPRLVLVVFGALAALGLGIMLYGQVFPDVPRLVRAADSAALSDALLSGVPAIVLCQNASHSGPAATGSVGLVVNKAARKAQAGVRTFRVDCDAALPAGVAAAAAAIGYAAGGADAAAANIYTRFGVQRGWAPAIFVVGNGRRPVQLRPTSAASAEDLLYAARQTGLIEAPKHTRIDNDVDLGNCIAERVGGCLMLYSRRVSGELGAELQETIEVQRSTVFATLKAGSLRLYSDNEALRALLKAAKEEAAALPGKAGTVLVFFARVPKELNNDVSGGIVASVHAAPSLLVDAEAVAAVRALSASALTKLGALNAAAASSGADAMDALLARDEELLRLGSAVVTKGELKVLHATTHKVTTESGEEVEEEDEGDVRGSFGSDRSKFDEQLGRREVRNQKRMEREARAERERDAAAAAAAKLSPEERAQRERQRRQEMAAEELANAHVAFAAMDGEDGAAESGAGGAGGAAAAEEEGAADAADAEARRGGGAAEEVVELADEGDL